MAKLNLYLYEGDVFSRDQLTIKCLSVTAVDVLQVVEQTPAYDAIFEQYNRLPGADRVDGVAVQRYEIVDRPIVAIKEALHEAVYKLYKQKLYGGVSIDFGGEYGARTLQTRERDRANWLTVKDMADDMIAASQGDDPLPVPLRTEDNTNIILSATAARAAMFAIREHQGGVMANAWSLKDQIEDCENIETLKAIDLNSGWPE